MKQYSLKSKLLSITFLVILAISSVLTWQTYSGISELSQQLDARTETDLKARALENLRANTYAYGEKIRHYINKHFASVQVLAETLQTNAGDNVAGQLTRDQLRSIGRAVAITNPNAAAVAMFMEPNTYDGRDEQFKGELNLYGFKNDGSLAIIWIRDGESLVGVKEVDSGIKYLSDLDNHGQRVAEWYLCPMESKQTCIVEPYWFELSDTLKVLMTSLVVPVLDQGEFLGLASMDLPLASFQPLAERLSADLYDGQSKVTLLSHNDIIVASSHYAEAINQSVSEVIPDIDRYKEQLTNNNNIAEVGGTLMVSYPLRIDAANTNWSIMIEVPLDLVLSAVQQQRQLIDQTKTSIISRQLLVSLILSAVSLGLMVLFIYSIVKPLQRLNSQVKQLSSSHGNLTQSLELNTHRELIDLSGGFNDFLLKLRQMITKLKDVSKNVRQMSSDSAAISHATQEKTDEQQLKMDSVVVSIQEMTATAQEVAGTAVALADKVGTVKTSVLNSQRQIADVTRAVTDLGSSMQSARDSIDKVSSRSADINKILEVIRSVAEQTNLLALNAAIEAARAGEQGRGFAVVADEVRELASKTHQSTKEIDDLISALQQEVQTSVDIITAGGEEVASVMASTHQTSESLNTVVAAILEINDHVNQVAASSEQQSAVNRDVSATLTLLGEAAQSLAKLADEANASSIEVTRQLDELDHQLNQLKT